MLWVFQGPGLGIPPALLPPAASKQRPRPPPWAKKMPDGGLGSFEVLSGGIGGQGGGWGILQFTLILKITKFVRIQGQAVRGSRTAVRKFQLIFVVVSTRVLWCWSFN